MKIPARAKSKDHSRLCSTAAPIGKIASAKDVITHFFKLDDDKKFVVGLKTLRDLSTHLIAGGYTHAALRTNDESRAFSSGKLTKICPQQIKAILDAAFRQAKFKLRVADHFFQDSRLEDSASREARFRKRFPHLRTLIVVPGSSPSGTISSELGKAAGRLLVNEFIERAHQRPLVGVGGGRTMRGVAIHTEFTHGKRKPFHIFPLNLMTRRVSGGEIQYDANYVAQYLKDLSPDGRLSYCPTPALPEKNQLAAATWHSKLCELNPDIAADFKIGLGPNLPDAVMLGMGGVYRECPTIRNFLQPLGMSFDTLDSMNPRPVGHINFCYFSEDGTDISSDLLAKVIKQNGIRDSDILKRGSFFEALPYSHPILLSYNIEYLRLLVGEGKNVVVVAGGSLDKAKGLLALIRSKTINGLVTESVFLDKMVEIDDSDSEVSSAK